MTINATTSQPVTPAEELREAVRLMRERAEKATPGPWLTDQSEIYSQVQGGPWVGETLKIDDDAQTRADSEHIAGWHPAVALAVATWLDGVATNYQTSEDTPECPSCDTGYCRHDKVTYHLDCDESVPCACIMPALAVARAYLGGTR